MKKRMMNDITMIETKVRRLFGRACAEYALLEDGDRVLVAVSGGKDSLELVRLMGRQQRILKPRISVEAVHVVMDNIPYETDRGYLQRFCEEQGVPLTVLHASFDESTDRRKTKCFLCAWNRRKALFRYAVEGGFNKIALGHHQDDFLVTLLMNMTFEGALSSMEPKMVMRNYQGVSVIRPLCLVPERMIKEVAVGAGFEKQIAACPYEMVTRRKDMEGVFAMLEGMNPEARYSMWRALMGGGGAQRRTAGSGG